MHGRRDWMELDERKEKILKAIIQNYLESWRSEVKDSSCDYSDLFRDRRAGWFQNDLQVFRFETQFGDDSK